jgi:predicted metal-dependent peptidase
MDVAKLMTRARTSLVLTQPFFGALSLRLKMVAAEIPTLSVDGKTLRYNPEFVQKLTFQQLVGCIAHEVMHCALAHHARRGRRDPRTFNEACDYAINPMIIAAGMTLPDDVLISPEFDGKPAEEIYGVLWGRKRQQQQQPEPGDEDKPGNEFEGDVGNCGSFCDSVDGQGKKHSPAERQAEEREWKTAGAEAIAVAKRAGSVSGSLVEMFDKLRAPRVDWREALRRFVGASAKQDYSWTPPNRRYVAAGLYLPSVRSDSVGEIVFAIDTSGSMNEEALQSAVDELNSILVDVEPERVHVIHCDTMIHQVEVFEPGDYPIKIEAKGRGGTRFSPVFEWISEQEFTPACVVYFTDLECYDFGTEPDCPVLWALAPAAREAETPFGETIKVAD